MCKACFDREYNEFDTYSEFEEFNKEFDSKIAKSVHFVENGKYRSDSHAVYKCSNCNQLWWFSDSDNHWRGYFLKEHNAKRKIDNDERKGDTVKYGCLVIVFLLIIGLIKSFY
ncbi:hypothetical protein [Flavobacterium dankookense]|uniref:Uncharacterized protein n=1 Tax=Flavobacterium dankookense TaxID=706186 RepID=A0A4V3CSI4_9FLAO|nr:hypothetical protein [Flavobacterium dankookense]TDP60802.1 hypothetical protein BC748_0402 [Flavobacterium dankookense]